MRRIQTQETNKTRVDCVFCVKAEYVKKAHKDVPLLLSWKHKGIVTRTIWVRFTKQAKLLYQQVRITKINRWECSEGQALFKQRFSQFAVIIKLPTYNAN